MLADDLSDELIRQINSELQKRKGMETLDLLRLARKAMIACNDQHCNEIFIEPTIYTEDEEIVFDILASNLVHAFQIQELFNMTVHMRPEGDKIIYTLLP